MIWKPVKGYETRYEVNETGQVRKTDGRLLGQFRNSHGYALVRVSQPRAILRVHRVVAEAFIDNPSNLPFVNHIDCARANNTVRNLEWCTQRDNLAHSEKLGRMQRDYWLGRRSPSATLSDEAAQEIRAKYSQGGKSFQSLASEYNTSKRTVGRIISGESYVLPRMEKH